ncbi:MAG: septum formation initiator family protein [Desulfobacterales bacterium]|jgi:cell division protein FtsB|nr:septum formation initiator family protein [Desulfobacterales bacterium]
MSRKQGILVSAAVFLIVSLLFFIMFSERGLADLNQMKKERDRLSSQNRQIIQENIGLGVEIDRLNNDPSYIESVARREFGMIGQDEIVVKPQRPPDR